MAKSTSTKGSKRNPAPASAPASTEKGAWATIDTTGKTPEEIAALAEQAIQQKKRKPRNKVSIEPAKGSKNTAPDQKIVKSGQKSPKETEKAPPKPVGRPSMFTQDIANQICAGLMEGKSLRRVCLADNMPSRTTVFEWLAANKEFADQYTRAREVQADVYAEDTIDIADDGSNDTYLDEDGNPRTDHDVIARSRLRVDARRWYAGKIRPKKYGDKVDVNHGVQPDNPLASMMTQLAGKTLKPVATPEDGDA